MATNNNATVDIAVYVSMDKNDRNRNVLSFIVQDECHLKKLAIGAYALKILDTKLLQSLEERKCNVLSGGDYVIVYNINGSNSINAILFNKNPIKLHKGMCLFKIIESNPPEPIVEHHNKTTGHFNVFAKSEPENNSTTNAHKIISPDSIELVDGNAVSAFEKDECAVGQIEINTIDDKRTVTAKSTTYTIGTTHPSSDTETAYSLIENDQLYDDRYEEEKEIGGRSEPDGEGSDVDGGRPAGSDRSETDDTSDFDDNDADEPVAKKRKSE
ncbi:TLP-20 [Alphabaculovirus altermyunipunctae]|uniref:TLP-20 n=1 Tax=Mythimna unipuncta nucleopolyhedrovirus TaxID=447897 RepID=A0A346TPL6_9ABAC|nr:TLP-20 [Mythimna unipuncta nucleopolyhedrovirus]AXU41526.1 TLP-20 [Mythimna unipuncta nucleopolyhedrovirus]